MVKTKSRQKLKHKYSVGDALGEGDKSEIQDLSDSIKQNETEDKKKGYFADSRYKSWRLIMRNLPFKVLFCYDIL